MHAVTKMADLAKFRHGFYDFGEFYSNSSKRNQPGGIEEFSAFSLLHAFLNILVLVRNSMHSMRTYELQTSKHSYYLYPY